jgi:hypothetical protein
MVIIANLQPRISCCPSRRLRPLPGTSTVHVATPPFARRSTSEDDPRRWLLPPFPQSIRRTPAKYWRYGAKTSGGRVSREPRRPRTESSPRIMHSARLQPLSCGCDSGSRLARTRVPRVAPWGAVHQPPKWWYARIWPSRAADGQSMARVTAGADSANPVVRSRLAGWRVGHHLLGEPSGVDVDMALSMNGVGGASILGSLCSRGSSSGSRRWSGVERSAGADRVDNVDDGGAGVPGVALVFDKG